MSIDAVEDDLLEYLLATVAGNDNPKLVPTIDAHGQPLDAFKIAWNASIAEEQGYEPLISSPAGGVNYFIFYSPKTKLMGYLSFYPINH
jgi:hypothetical protein